MGRDQTGETCSVEWVVWIKPPLSQLHGIYCSRGVAPVPRQMSRTVIKITIVPWSGVCVSFRSFLKAAWLTWISNLPVLQGWRTKIDLAVPTVTVNPSCYKGYGMIVLNLLEIAHILSLWHKAERYDTLVCLSQRKPLVQSSLQYHDV